MPFIWTAQPPIRRRVSCGVACHVVWIAPFMTACAIHRADLCDCQSMETWREDAANRTQTRLKFVRRVCATGPSLQRRCNAQSNDVRGVRPGKASATYVLCDPLSWSDSISWAFLASTKPIDFSWLHERGSIEWPKKTKSEPRLMQCYLSIAGQ